MEMADVGCLGWRRRVHAAQLSQPHACSTYCTYSVLTYTSASPIEGRQAVLGQVSIPIGNCNCNQNLVA